jgi:hypothetical protein
LPAGTSWPVAAISIWRTFSASPGVRQRDQPGDTSILTPREDLARVREQLMAVTLQELFAVEVLVEGVERFHWPDPRR